MTQKRSQFVPVVMAMFTALAANACSSSDSSDDDDAGASGEGVVLNGGSSGTSGGSGGSGGSTGGNDGGTSFTGGTGTGGSSSGGTGGTTGGAGGSGNTAGSDASGGDAGAPPATGGAGGTGGTTGGAGGGAGMGGTGGSSGASGDGVLGDACAADSDCSSGLICIKPDDEALGGGAPPNGLCTMACEADTECAALEAGSYCVAFNEEMTILYCLEGCETGMLGVPKCQERPDFACGLLALADTTTACTTSDDCGDAQICNEDTGVCGDTVTGCVPMCGGDYDCQTGQYCDFLSGMCLAGEETGLAIGAACDPSATTDPCAGFCQFVDEAGTAGVCAGFCTVNAQALGCGWSGTGAADAACLYGTRLSPPDDLAAGDLGICGALCDCNDDCAVSLMRCIDDSDGLVSDIWGRAGYCRPLAETETEADSIACN
jgi:hypothetical protein